MKWYVMYWNNREDYPVAVFEVHADSEIDAVDIACENGGEDYERTWPLLVYGEDDPEAPNEDEIRRYKKSVYTDYYEIKN